MTTPIIIEINSMITAMKSLEIYNDFMEMLNIFSNKVDYKNRKASFFYELDFSGFYFGDFKCHLFEVLKDKLKKFKLNKKDYEQALNFVTASRILQYPETILIRDLHLTFLRINFRFLHGLTPKEIIDVIKTTENILNINKVNEIISLKDILTKQQINE